MIKHFYISNKDIYSFIFVFLIKTVLDLYYSVFITNIWGYEGYYLSITISRVVISYFILIPFYIISIFIKKKNPQIYFLYILLLIVYYIPNLTMFAYMHADPKIILGLSVFLLSIAFSVYFKFNINTFGLDYKSQNLVITGLIVVVASIFLFTYKLQIFPKVLFFQDIYEARANFSSKGTVLHEYLLGWLVKIIAPIGLIWALLNKKRLLVILSIVSLLYIYLLSGHKSVFLTTFVLLFFYVIKGSVNKKTSLMIILFLILLLCIPLIDLLIDRNLFKGIFITRLFFMPSLLNVYYFDFFDHKAICLSHSIFSSFLDYPYQLSPANQIGMEYFNKPEMMANNGVVSDAFMNFGFSGILVFSFFIFLFFVYLNSFSIDDAYLGLFVIFSRLFISSGFLTFFLTHGVLLFIILLPLIMQKKE